MLLTANQAEAKKYRQSNFYDFGYAAWAWQNLKTREQLIIENNKVYPAYKKFNKIIDRKKAQQYLQDSPDAKLIKKGHDLALAYKIWSKGYREYDCCGDPDLPWNYNRTDIVCTNMQFTNIFTKSCTDYPDWRTEKSRLRDEASVAKRRANKKKRNSQ